MVLGANRKGIRPHFLMRRVLICKESHASYLPSNDLLPRYQGVSLLTNWQRTTWFSSYHFASSSSSSFFFLYSPAILFNLCSLLIIGSPLHVLRNSCSHLILKYLVIFVQRTSCQSMFVAWNVPDAYLSILYEWSHNIFIKGLLRLRWSLYTLKMGGEKESWRSVWFVLRTKPGFKSKQLSMNHQVLSPLKKDLVFNRPWLSLSYLPISSNGWLSLHSSSNHRTSRPYFVISLCFYPASLLGSLVSKKISTNSSLYLPQWHLLGTQCLLYFSHLSSHMPIEYVL